MEDKKLLTIESIDIKNLFEIFNYKIEYPKDENVLIITGPNGFGKTQVLNIIYNLFNRKFVFFQNLVFDEITVNLNDGISIEILKKEINTKSKTKKRTTQLNIIFRKKKSIIEDYTYSSKIDVSLSRHLDSFLPVSRLDNNRWVNHRTDQIYSLEEVIEEFSDQLPPEITNSFQTVKTKLANEILDSIDVHLIREQRLFQKVSRRDSRHYSSV